MDTLQHINLSFSNNLHTTTKDYRHMDISVLLGCCNQDKSLIYEECCQKQYTTRSDFFYKDSIIKAFFLPKRKIDVGSNENRDTDKWHL